MERPLEIFFSYAHEDEDLMNDVRRQLVVYERNGRILKWHDRQIPPGAEWRERIDKRLEQADIVLLFVSPHFIESRYCYEIEGEAAIRRHKAGAARVVPVILRPCSWRETPFGTLQALPRDGKPLTRWADRDEACLDVARGIMTLVDEMAANPSRRVVEDTESAADAGAREQPHMADTESLAQLLPVVCTSPACRSQDIDLSDGVEISGLKADANGWSVHGVVQLDYSVQGQCRTCGRLFQVVKRQIPLQFPELTCNECERRAFLQYKIQELKKIAGGFEFGVEIRCSGCEGRKKLMRLVSSLLRTIGIRVDLNAIDVTHGSPNSV